MEALTDLLPAEHMVYVGDTARYPYGPRSVAELRAFSEQIVDHLLGFGVKLVVVACNSATAAALDDLRARHDIPIIGVVAPGVRAAMAVSRTKRVGVIGTAMTESSKVYQRVARQERSGLDLKVHACPSFVDLVESGRVEGAEVEQLVARDLAPILAADVDTLVLGCTHFPLLARPIKEVVGTDITLVSSADETAFEVRAILERVGWARGSDDPGTRTYLTSGDPERFAELGERFLGRPLGDVRGIAWPRVNSA